MTRTLYRIRDDRGVEWTTSDTEAADRLSRAGLQVTAATYTDN
jgi:hypothetical protein